MSTRSTMFFMRPAEFSALVREIALDLGVRPILLRRGRERHLEFAEPPDLVQMRDGRPADELYWARERPDLANIDVQRLRPATWGWVSCDVPQEQDDTLFIAQIAAKSDWYDTESQQVREQPASHELFARMRPRLSKQLRRPVWAMNVRTGHSRAYRDIGYTDGVLAWVRGGGKLRQAGVKNAAFALEDPRGTPDVPE